MEIIRAEKMGFCFGVQQAIDNCQKYISQIAEGKNVYILGMLVHNEYVVDKLEKQGFKIINEKDLYEGIVKLVPEDTVVVRAHGIPKNVYEFLRKKQVKIEDSACIFVKKIREKLIELENLGDEIIFIGDKEHPEVEGIISFGKNITVLKDLDELKKFKIFPEKSYSLLTQTTLNKEKMQEIKKHLEKQHMNVKIFNKICGATEERQEAVEKLARISDIVLIIGGKKSSNTKKLYEISKTVNENTKLINDEWDIDIKWFKGIKKIGITAGASTPEELIQKIENKIKEELHA